MTKRKLLLPPLACAAACGAAAVFGPADEPAQRLLFLIGAGGTLALTVLRTSYGPPASVDSAEPRPLRLSWLDAVKAFLCWVDAFKQSFAVAPGLYYLGDRYDRDAPLLVTSNHHLTVYLVARQAAPFGVRLLVVDTGGINVWCAATKRQFSNQSIYDQVERYDRELLTDKRWLRLILPKRCCAGVSLRDLRGHHIRGVIGPLRSRSLPAYLSSPPLEDQNDDIMEFDIAARAYCCLPGLVQYIGYGLCMAAALVGIDTFWGIWPDAYAPMGLVGVVTVVGIAYPLLFPWLPGHRFAVKGMALGLAVAALLVAGGRTGVLGWPLVLPAALFSVGIAMFIALTFTGNSPVSAYTKVRLETAHFMPASILLLAGSVVSYLLEVPS